MKALIFEEQGHFKVVLKLKEVLPPILDPTQALVAVKARPVNPSDELFMIGKYRNRPVYPQIAGLEGSGIIMKCGSLVADFKAGDHVAFRSTGTWAEEIAVEEQQLIKIDKELPFDISCQIALNGITAMALLEESGLNAGDFLLLDAGSTSLSHLVLQLARTKGIRIIVLTRNANQAHQLLKIGAEKVLDQGAPDLAIKIQEVTGDQKISCFMDAVGGKILTTVIPLMRQYSLILLYGNLSANESAVITNGNVIYQNLTIKGFGIDNWLANVPVPRIRLLYQEVIDSLDQHKLFFRQSHCIAMNDFLTEMKYENANKKLIITS